MKLVLFGGAEIDKPNRSVNLLKSLIKNAITETQSKSIVNIPFARPQTIPEDNGQWNDGWLNALLAGSGIKIMDARQPSGITPDTISTIFIGGGPQRQTLIDSINKYQLNKMINQSKTIIAESSGSMILGIWN